MRRTFSALMISLACAALVAGCARSVRVLDPPAGDPPPVQANPVTFTVEFHPRADVSTFRATLDPPAGSGATGPVDITGSFSPPLAAGGQSSATVSVPQSPCTFLRVGCIDERRLRVEGRMAARQAFDLLGDSRAFRLPGTPASPPPPPPPTASPSFQLAIPQTAAVSHWGAPASYAVQVESLSGFAGPVTLSAQNLPAGASAAPVVVNLPANGTATATVTVTTARAGTALGPHAFTLRATSPNVAARTRNLDLRVLPAEEAFGSLTWLTGPSSCNGIQAVVSGTVSFQGSGFPNTTGLPFVWYAFTPDCQNARGAAVIGPSAGVNLGHPVNLFNLGFSGQIADSPGSTTNLPAAAWDQTQFRVAADGSHLIAVSESGGSHHASLWNMLELYQINPPRPYALTGSLSAAVAGDRVEGTPSVGNPFSWPLP